MLITLGHQRLEEQWQGRIAGHYWRLHTQPPQAWEHEVVVGENEFLPAIPSESFRVHICAS